MEMANQWRRRDRKYRRASAEGKADKAGKQAKAPEHELDDNGRMAIRQRRWSNVVDGNGPME